MVWICKQCISFILICAVSLLSTDVFAVMHGDNMGKEWGYKGNIGPDKWGRLTSSFESCIIGHTQSPINIPKKTVALSTQQLKIDYHPAPLDVVDKIHDVEATFSANEHQIITFAGKSYLLYEFHVHSPSEHQWRGQSFPLEVHLVHESGDGQLAVIAVFVKGGASNPALAEMAAYPLPRLNKKETPNPELKINPKDLLPEKRGYYYYVGSLTTPPCTEGVRWIVMTHSITATPAEIMKLRQAAEGPNARPVQPLNGRQVYYYSDKESSP